MNPTLHIDISIERQRLVVARGSRALRSFPVSSAARGIGFTPGSYRTPTGRFEIAAMIGAGCPAGTIFKGRRPAGFWSPATPTDEDLILTRILRLHGLEPWNANSLGRCIYIHGTNREDLLGSPASMGCIRMSNAGVAELFSLVTPGTPVVIKPPARSPLRFAVIDATPPRTLAALARSAAPAILARLQRAGWTPAVMIRGNPATAAARHPALARTHLVQCPPPGTTTPPASRCRRLVARLRTLASPHAIAVIRLSHPAPPAKLLPQSPACPRSSRAVTIQTTRIKT